MTYTPGSSESPKLTFMGKLFVFLFIVGTLAGAYYLFTMRGGGRTQQAGVGGGSTVKGEDKPVGEVVEIGVAYGTEKRRWLEGAVKAFAASPEGRGIKVELLPMGSLEGAQAVVKGDKRIHAWSPASTLYLPTFVADYQARHSGNPVLKGENLALTPMVFIMWEERHKAFVARYKDVNLKTVAQALQEPGGWETIAGKPNWGVFKFAHTHPNQSSSGLTTLVLTAYVYHGKNKGLEMRDILDLGFQKWLGELERGVTGMSHSTGTMVKEMVLKGPSSYDCVMAYENTAIDYLENAKGRWDAIRVVYPRLNMWNESPYYVLDVPWSSAEQRKAATVFMQFLLSEAVQKEAVVHGFRPANPNVAIKYEGSPFVMYAANGISDDLGVICEPPGGDVLNNLLQVWQRTRGDR